MAAASPFYVTSLAHINELVPSAELAFLPHATVGVTTTVLAVNTHPNVTLGIGNM